MFVYLGLFAVDAQPKKRETLKQILGKESVCSKLNKSTRPVLALCEGGTYITLG